MAIAGIAAGLLGRLLLDIPAVVEWHRSTFFPLAGAALQQVFGANASSIGEIMAMMAAAVAIAAVVRARTRAVAPLAAFAGLVVFAFYASWGLAYRYPPLSSRLPTLSASNEAPEHLIAISGLSARFAAKLSPETFSTAPDAELLSRINTALAEGFSVLPPGLEASPIRAITFGPTRFSYLSFAMSRLQLSGYYFPWTGEAHINRQMPRSAWARTAAHERAHQRGFARENEATVMGVLACLGSGDPLVRYSGALGLFIALDREVARRDTAARKQLWDVLPPRVLRDLREEEAFWNAHEGAPARVSERVNDTYLKAQGVVSGIVSYSETTRLFLQALETESLSATAFRSLR